MKKRICILAISLGISMLNPAQAQEKQAAKKQLSPEQRADKRTEMMTAKLMLTEDQQPKVREALLKMEQNQNNDREKSMQQKKEFDAEMKQILNPEQIEKYEALKAQRKAQIKKSAEDARAQEKINASETEENKLDQQKN